MEVLISHLLMFHVYHFLLVKTNVPLQFYSANWSLVRTLCYQTSLQLLSTGLIGAMNQIDQFENDTIYMI